MSSQDEDCKPNRFNKYGILFQNRKNLTKPEIMEMFNVFEDDEPLVFCPKNGFNVFINYELKEHATKARTMFPELKAIFANDKKGPDQNLIQSWKENKESDRKGGYNSKYDSDNKSCSSVGSTSTLPRYQNSKTSMDRSTVNDATQGSSQHNAKQNMSGSGGINKSETKESTPSISNSSVSLNSNVEDSGEMPLLVCSYDVEAVEGLRTVETKVVVLSNLPPWLHTGEVFRLIHESTNLWPLEVEVLHKEVRVVLHSAYVHFRSLKEAEECVKTMNYMWVESRQLICVLLDEVIMPMS